MRALIIDDERIARQELRRLLAAHPEVEIAGEAASGEQALELIQKLAPDLLLLDIQMPAMTGFDLLDRLREVPDVIFTTAYDQHALKAFEETRWIICSNQSPRLVLPRLCKRFARTRFGKRLFGKPWNKFSCAMANAAGSSKPGTSICWNPKATTPGCSLTRSIL